MRQKRDAFTLIELLVVVSTICLLVAILMPTLSQAKELARRAGCAGGLHQLGMAFQMWANGHNKSLPLGTRNYDWYLGARWPNHPMYHGWYHDKGHGYHPS